MPITDQETWNNYVQKNTSAYGRKCTTVARRVMEILDDVDDFEPDDLIHQAQHETGSDSLTVFMELVVVSAVFQCHSRGEEFRNAWFEDVQPEQGVIQTDT